jgi:hypothetical protein
MIRVVHHGYGSRILIFLAIPDPGSRGQNSKDTGSRIQNRNTESNISVPYPKVITIQNEKRRSRVVLFKMSRLRKG